MSRIIFALIIASTFLLSFACSGQNAAGGASSPADAYKRLFEAVKSKDTEAIKKQMSKKTIELGVMQSQRNKKPIEQVYENGFTATTFSDSLPNIRDERVKNDMGSVEIWNSKESKWEDLPFIKEDGGWKLAIGDLFAGNYVSPGPGRDFLEKQAANAISNPSVMLPSNSNANSVSVGNSAPPSPKSEKNKK